MGPFRADFFETSDSPDRPQINLTLVANLVEAVSIAESGPVEVATPGRPSTKRFRLTLRRAKSGSSDVPRIETSPGLVASFEGPTSEQEGPGGSQESARDLSARLPALEQLGPQVAEIVLNWPGGRRWTHDIQWDVIPSWRVVPKSIVLTPDESRRVTVAARSTDRPFRILTVAGATLDGHRIVAGADSAGQSVEVRLDPSRARSAASRVDFMTDDPRNPLVSLNVIVPR